MRSHVSLPAPSSARSLAGPRCPASARLGGHEARGILRRHKNETRYIKSASYHPFQATRDHTQIQGECPHPLPPLRRARDRRGSRYAGDATMPETRAPGAPKYDDGCDRTFHGSMLRRCGLRRAARLGGMHARRQHRCMAWERGMPVPPPTPTTLHDHLFPAGRRTASLTSSC